MTHLFKIHDRAKTRQSVLEVDAACLDEAHQEALRRFEGMPSVVAAFPPEDRVFTRINRASVATGG